MFVKQQFGRGDSVAGATSGSTSARGDSLEGEDAAAAAAATATATGAETGDLENPVRISPKSPLSPKSPESVSSTCTSEDANRCDVI